MQWLTRGWYSSPSWQWVLAPLAVLFFVVVSIRRKLYAKGVLASYKSKLPVIIVGNISVGGNGKTPIVLALINYFLAHGKAPAVLSRGYGGALTSFPTLVDESHDATVIGDEPAMIFARRQIPIVIDPDRRRGIKMLERIRDIDVVICDDGMQHYALQRDIELCVMDSRGVGNGHMLPLGPLRESRTRLHDVDLLLINGTLTSNSWGSVQNSVNFTLAAEAFVNVRTNELLSPEQARIRFEDNKVCAIAGIGNPQRFFETLNELGFAPTSTSAFPDHHHFTASDIEHSAVVLMTEKDAIKCKAIAHNNCWYLRVNATLPESVYDNITTRLWPTT